MRTVRPRPAQSAQPRFSPPRDEARTRLPNHQRTSVARHYGHRLLALSERGLRAFAATEIDSAMARPNRAKRPAAHGHDPAAIHRARVQLPAAFTELRRRTKLRRATGPDRDPSTPRPFDRMAPHDRKIAVRIEPRDIEPAIGGGSEIVRDLRRRRTRRAAIRRRGHEHIVRSDRRRMSLVRLVFRRSRRCLEQIPARDPHPAGPCDFPPRGGSLGEPAEVAPEDGCAQQPNQEVQGRLSPISAHPVQESERPLAPALCSFRATPWDSPPPRFEFA